jgi:hypothetical protein
MAISFTINGKPANVDATPDAGIPAVPSLVGKSALGSKAAERH